MKQSRGGTRIIGKPSKISLPNKPLVSIVTACLNSEKYLEQTIQSVLGQTYDNIEYIIVDGGSTDKTLDIIRKYEEYIAYWVSEPDKGLYDAMNKGVSFTDGEWIGIINSDDFYAEDTVKWVVEAARTDKEAQLFCGNISVLNSRECADPRACREYQGRPGNLLKEMNFFQPTWFVSREIYAKLKFNINFKFAADWDFAIKLYLDNIKLGYINESLVYFRPNGISSSFSARREIDQIKTFCGMLCLPFMTRAAAKKSLEIGRPSFGLLFLNNTLQIFPLLHNILKTALKLTLANIHPKLTRGAAGKYRKKLHDLLTKLSKLFKAFFYRYGQNR
ncbi:MAG: glycosyltransferase family 2 protein [Candidatus Ratteibacteria bacterium]